MARSAYVAPFLSAFTPAPRQPALSSASSSFVPSFARRPTLCNPFRPSSPSHRPSSKPTPGFVPLLPVPPTPCPSEPFPQTTPATTQRRTIAPTAALASLFAPTPLVIAGALVSFALSAALGANDVANSLGTAVGTGAIKVTTALVIGAVMEFAGAVLFGSTVTKTISSGVVTVTAATLASPVSYMCGMLAVLIGCTVWMAVATKYGLPVSSTHSVVGALIGLGIVSGWGISTNAVRRIVMSWFLSPMIGGSVALVIYRMISFFILDARHPTRAIRRSLPILAGGASFTLASSILGKSARFGAVGPDQLIFIAIAVSLACTGLAGAFATMLSLNMNGAGTLSLSPRNGTGNGTGEAEQVVSSLTKEEEKNEVEQVFKVLQVLTACLLSFSHGSNDVSNAIGPFAAMYSTWLHKGRLDATVSIPFWCLLLGGLGISSGLGLFGRPVMETVGQKITILKPTMGFCVEFSTALTVLLASKLGLPVSTTHTLIGCIVALGLANGDRSRINKGVLVSIAGSWGVTLPFSAIVTVVFYALMRPFIPAVPTFL